MNIILYGIPNCDTVKKARGWLAENGVAYRFHDFKKEGVPAGRLDDWIAQAGLEKLVNRRGQTWRQLDAAVQDSAKHAAGAKAVMLAHFGVIKRPVVEWGTKTTVGFDAGAWALLAGR